MNTLYAPDSYYILTEKGKREICNGCGQKSKFDFVPDTIWFLDISEACNIHDYQYHIGEILGDKIQADCNFLDNMIRLINENTKWKWLKKLRYHRANIYYQAVKRFGGPAFWAGKG